jgi:hypothetical protein
MKNDIILGAIAGVVVTIGFIALQVVCRTVSLLASRH